MNKDNSGINTAFRPDVRLGTIIALAAMLVWFCGAGVSPGWSDEEATSSVRQVQTEPWEWRYEVETARSAEFLEFPSPPASVRNIAGEPFILAKEAPEVDFIIYPDTVNALVPNPPLWSSWGRGGVGIDGCFYSAIGDHGGVNSETVIYQYDPERKAIRRVTSLQELAGHQPGDWGYGKIHGWIECDEEGWLYFAGYWGTHPGGIEQLSPRYQGGEIARYNIYTHYRRILCVAGARHRRLLACDPHRYGARADVYAGQR